MVVSADDCSGASDDGGSEDFAWMGQGCGGRSTRDGDSAERSVFAIEENHVEHLVHGMNFQDVLHIGVNHVWS